MYYFDLILLLSELRTDTVSGLCDSVSAGFGFGLLSSSLDIGDPYE